MARSYSKDYANTTSMDYGRSRKSKSNMDYDQDTIYRGDKMKVSTRMAPQFKAKMSENELLQDGKQSAHVFPIETSTEKYDMGRMKYDNAGLRGYSRKAWDYMY